MRINGKGFTLVELMVVLAILGLLAGIGIPQYLATLERARVAADAAVVATVQSAVNGFMAETGAKGTDLQTAADDSTLNIAYSKDSVLSSTAIAVSTFLPGAALPVDKAFKSVTGVAAGDWKINDSGKVYVLKGGVYIPTGVTP